MQGWDRDGGDLSKMSYLRRWLISATQTDRRRRKKECITKIHLCVCWPKEGSIQSTVFAVFAAAVVLMVLAAVNWYLLKPPQLDINYFFPENFRAKYTLILGLF